MNLRNRAWSLVVAASVFVLACGVNARIARAQDDDFTLTVELSDYSGNPVLAPADVAVGCKGQNSGEDVATGTILSGESSATLTIASADTNQSVNCSLGEVSGYSVSGYAYFYAFPGSSQSSVFYLRSTSASVDISFVDQSGNPVTANSGTISCADYNGQNAVTATLDSGDTHKEINLVADTYFLCKVGEGSDFGSFIPPSYDTYVYTYGGSSSTAQLVFTAIDSTLLVNFVNTSGDTLTLPSGVTISCTDYSHTYSSTLGSSASSVSFDVVGGSYIYCSIPDSSQYSAPYTFVYVGQNTDETVSMTVTSLSATLSIVFQTTAGGSFAVPDGISYAAVYGSSFSGGAYFNETVSTGDTSISVPVQPGTYFVGAYGLGSAQLDEQKSVTVAEGETAEVVLRFSVADATINVNLVNGSGDAVAVDTGSYAYVYAYDQTTYRYYYNTISSGSSTTLDVIGGGGTIAVYAYYPGSPVQGADVVVASGGTGTANLVVSSRDASVDLRFVNQSGTLVTDIENATAYCYFYDGLTQDYNSAPFTDGVASVALITGKTYTCYIYAYSSGASYGTVQSTSGTTYILPSSTIEVSGTTGTQNVTLGATDSTIRVTATRSNGSAISGIWVSAYTGSYYTGAITDENGRADFAVSSGSTYTIQAYAYDPSLVPPGSEEVTPTSGNVSEVSQVFGTPDFSLAISATASASNGSFSCSAYTDSGRYTYGELVDLSATETLGLISADPVWNIYCYGFGNDSDGNYMYYVSDAAQYTIASGTTTGTLSVPLVAYGEAYKDSGSCDSNGGEILFGSEGNSVTIPPGTFDEDAGNVNIGIESGSPDGTLEENEDAIAFTITATDSEGDQETPNGTYTVDVAIPGNSGDELEANFSVDGGMNFSATAQDITDTSESARRRLAAMSAKGVKAFAEKRIVRMTLNRTNGKVTLKVKHQASATPTPTPDPSVEAPGAPTSVTAKAKNGKLTITWSDPTSGGTVESFEVDLDNKGGKTVKTTTVAASVHTATFKGVKAGNFTVKIYAKNSGGTSAAASKSVKVKPGKDSGKKKKKKKK